MAKLITLRGNSGSGKSTIAKELQKKFGRNTMLISQDVIRREMLRVRDREGNESIALLKELLRYGHGHSDVTILEGILYADWYRSLFELARDLYGSQLYAYYLDISFEETVRRHQTKPNCHEFGEEAMRRWWREKDYSDVLSETIITEEQDLMSIVSEIYDEVTA